MFAKKMKEKDEVAMEASGLTVKDKNGNEIIMDATSGGIPGTPGIAINGGKKVCLEGLIDWLIKHKHMGNMGAPCPVFPADLPDLIKVMAMPDGKILSAKVTLE